MRIIAVVPLLLLAAVGTSQTPAFLDVLSAAPGERVNVHVSTAQNYEVRVWRSHYFTQNTELLRSPPIQGTVQPTVRGSFAEAPTSPELEITGSLTLEAWVRPLQSGNGNRQGILSKYSVPGHAAYMIYLMPSGRLSFYLGDTGVFNENNRTLTTGTIRNSQWTHVVATYDGQNKRIYLNGELDVTQARTGPIFDTTEPVRVAAYGASGAAGQVFDGQIDSPAIYDRALTPAEITQRFGERADYSASAPGVLPGAVAQWNFAEGDAVTLADATGNGNDLTVTNYGTRGVPGPSPRPDPSGSHSIRFASDDGMNPSWKSDFGFTIDPGWESGFYYVEVRIFQQTVSLPLVVKPAPGQERRIAVLAATNTWHAYNNWRRSLYQTHPGGAIAYYVGMRQPNPGGRAYVHRPGSGSLAHLVDAERYLYKWLDDNGHPFDLYSDLDLHQNPSLLDSYDVLMLSGHSEYWSHEMIDHVEAFLDGGGSLVNLSGNTMWSLVTYDSTYSVMEGRKHPHGSGTIPANERWHGQAGGVLGGTMRCIGRPEHEVIGTGYGIGNGSARGWAKVLLPQHWVFAGTGVSAGQTFGRIGLNGGSMMGFEIDVVDPQWTPANVQVLAVGQYPTPTFQLGITNCQTRTSWNVLEGGDVIYYDHPGGGGVFGIPSVTVGGTLVLDSVASQMLRNVMDRFLGTAASCSFRNGSGVNPAGFACVTDPVLGSSWQTTVATTASTVSTALGLAAASGQVAFGGGEILIGLSPAPLFLPGTGAHAVPIPSTSTLLGARLSTQGFRVDMVGGAASLVMLNAQDLRLGL